jgi:protein TonB
MKRAGRWFLLAGVLAGGCGTAAAQPAVCVVKQAAPAPAKLADTRRRARELERQLAKNVQEMRRESASANATRRAKLEALIAQAETHVLVLRGIQAREYCPVDAPGAAAFLQEVARRIEECGTRNFPMQGATKLYGAAEAEYVLAADGALVSRRILETSKQPALDAHVLRLLDASAPFPAVPDELRQGKYQHFRFSSKFDFAHGPDVTVPEPRTRCRM